MTRVVRVLQESWPLVRPFAISRGSKTAAEVVVVEIEESGAIGRGECVPYTRYGESPASVTAEIAAIIPLLAGGLNRDRLSRQLPAGAARNAVDCALWDLEAKRSGQAVWRLAGLPAPAPVITAETIGLDSPAVMATAAAALSDRPLLKVKLNGEAIIERVAAVRDAAPEARLIVDANEAWTLPTLTEVMPDLARLGVTVIEQPLPAAADAALAGYHPPVQLCADESFHTSADFGRLVDAYGMVNIKLDKTGGFSEALGAVTAARARGLEVMLGCMVSTSLAIAPALLLAPCAQVIDLDGPIWLRRDRAPPLRFERATISPASRLLWG